MDPDDPWFWSVDRVIQELCTPDRSWQLLVPVPVPDPDKLTATLRKQEISGCLLLLYVDDQALRTDFNYHTYPQRAYILAAITELRQMSAHYRDYKSRIGDDIGSRSLNVPINRAIDASSTSSGPSSGQHQVIQGSAHASQTSLQSPVSPSHSPAPHDNEILSLTTGNSESNGDLAATDESSSKRRKLEHISSGLSDEIVEDAPTLPAESVSKPIIEEPSQTQAVSLLESADGQATGNVPSLSKKRKRIAPTLISTDIDTARHRQMPTEADTVLRNNPEVVQPGVPFVADDGRKRLVPVRQTNLDGESYDYNQLLQQSKPSQLPPTDKPSDKSAAPKKANGRRVGLKTTAASSSRRGYHSYLGKKKMTVDDIFYAGTAVGQELPTEDPGQISLCPTPRPSGQRLYVHHMMRGYLRSEPTAFKRNDSLFYGVRPYSSKLTPRFQSPSFTLFHVDDGGKAYARREEVPRWPEVGPSSSNRMPGPGVNNTQICSDLGMGILSEVGSHATLDPDSLIKYQYFPGAEEVWPIYGESDEENEYDLETWKEMEEERGTLERPMRPLKRPPISLGDVNDAIDEAIGELVAKWHRVQFPKKQQKAFRIWTKFHKNRQARRDHREEIQKQLDRINDDRLPKLRKGILDETWSSKSQVKQQTRIMEQSIFDRESSIWEINLLKSRLAPEKPTRNISSKISKKLPSQTQDGEDGESIGNSSDASLSDDDMDDFVVEDILSMTEEIEMNLGDTQDERPGSVDLGSSHSSESETTTRPQHNVSALLASTADQVVKEETSLAETLPTLSSNAGNPIDLTMLSSDDGPNTPTVDLTTPKKPRITHIHKSSPFTKSPIAISDEEIRLPNMNNLPPYDDPDAIAQFSHNAWASISDRERLLISVVNKLDDKLRTAMFTFISSFTEHELWHHMLDFVDETPDKRATLKGMDEATFQTLTEFVRLFLVYAECKYRSSGLRTTSRLGNVPDKHKGMFRRFYMLCRKLEGYFDGPIENPTYEDRDDDEELMMRRQSVNATSTDTDFEEQGSQRMKPRKKLFENKEARDMRAKEHQRRADQELRRKRLQQKLPILEYCDGVRKIVINDGKYEEEGLVYVSKEIAPRIKPHQVEGVKFMWSQIVTGTEGCLLAHTMGLGKTMQVITLLCAIAEAAKSPDETVTSQIPVRLRSSRTLVLCPPSLIDNWMDELLMWTPKGLLGDFRKCHDVGLPERVQTIKDWFDSGGVLILGYQMFRNLYENKKTEEKDPRLDADEHKETMDRLLEGPNIIIADEAHMMKNPKTGVAKSTKEFKSKSRIALTGSPLANSVDEYHSMIDWIAENYLGPADEFRQKYAEPIQAGLWHDSSRPDRRKSLKMLRVLGHDLAPKVHRADMSVLRNDLPPKKEFIITVPLTELQTKAYMLYVQSMSSGTAHTTKDGEFTQTTIWTWLGILQLLCNHPGCFKEKLSQPKEKLPEPTAKGRKKGSARKPTSGTDLEEDTSTDLSKPTVGVSLELINKVRDLFEQEANLMTSSLSYKAKILLQILDRSKAAGDKVLVFSQSIPTLNYLEELCQSQQRKYFRLDGSTKIPKRQEMIRNFNGGDTDIGLISSAAGGLGLNITGANRVVVFDFKYNPTVEDQAVGRAYRIGQKKDVFVYRLIAGGTFEESMHNKAVFKTQLASRVVDKKNPVAWARKGLVEMLHEPKKVEQKDLSGFVGMDPLVLDAVLASQSACSTIRGIVQSDTFEQDSNDKLTAEEEIEVQQLIKDKNLERSDPAAFYRVVSERNLRDRHRHMGIAPHVSGNPLNNSRASSYAVTSHRPPSFSQMAAPPPRPQPFSPMTALPPRPRQFGPMVPPVRRPQPTNSTAARPLPPPPPSPAAIAGPDAGVKNPEGKQLTWQSPLPPTQKHSDRGTTAPQPLHTAIPDSPLTESTSSPTDEESGPSSSAKDPVSSQPAAGKIRVTTQTTSEPDPKPKPVTTPQVTAVVAAQAETVSPRAVDPGSDDSKSGKGRLGNIEEVCISANPPAIVIIPNTPALPGSSKVVVDAKELQVQQPQNPSGSPS